MPRLQLTSAHLPMAECNSTGSAAFVKAMINYKVTKKLQREDDGDDVAPKANGDGYEHNDGDHNDDDHNAPRP